MGLDVHERRQIELLGPRAVARLPDREQLGQSPPVARGERRRDGVEGMSERGRDLVILQVRGARLDVVAVGLQPFVIVGGDAVTEHVDGLGLTLERCGQLLGDERVGKVTQRQDPIDRVVISDRHEVHAPALGELVDLERLCSALGDPKRPLDAELRDLRGRGVDVQVGAAGFVHAAQDRPANEWVREERGHVL